MQKSHKHSNRATCRTSFEAFLSLLTPSGPLVPWCPDSMLHETVLPLERFLRSKPRGWRGVREEGGSK
eukprot:747932-Hanusia_phi.AAC.2